MERLLQNIGRDPIGRIFYPDLLQRYEEDQGTKQTNRSLGDKIRKLFPDVVMDREFHKGARKKITTFRGIYLRAKGIQENVMDWTDIYGILPSSAMLLTTTLCDKITFALKSDVVTNGSIVLKEVTLQKNPTLWSLSIRSRSIPLTEYGLCNKFTFTREKFEEIIHTVNLMNVCTGVPVDKVCGSTENLMKENYSSFGDENLIQSMYRSKNCLQVVPFTSKSNVCSKCKALCKTEKETSNCRFMDKCDQTENSSKETNQTQSQQNVDSDEKDDKKESKQANENESIEVNEKDHLDLSKILESIFPNAPEKMKILLKSQHQALKAKSPTARRWNKEVISMCLSLWVRSPKAYATIQESGMLILPSGRQLLRYKNCIPQHAGLNDKVFQWMREAALDSKVPSNGWSGGIHHDETKVQKDLVLDMTGGKPTLLGWIDLGEEAFNIKVLKERSVQPELASEVIQISFLGYTGFRFPVCHYPTKSVKASELNIILWKTIAKLHDWGFNVDYIMQDGGEENRNFMKMHFAGSPLLSAYGSPNLVNPYRRVYHTQDFSHNVKKLRNSILKSGHIKGLHTRTLQLHKKEILWKHWERAVEWDRNTNHRRLHYKVTESHLHPNIAEKMRNELAESMLDNDMLHLMKCYANSLQEKDFLDSSIELLEKTSTMISIFRDQRLITSTCDNRFTELQKIYDWFHDWEEEISKGTIPANLKAKALPSRQCLDDTMCMLSTFPAICQQHLSGFPFGSIKPSRFNNDIAENIFCQQKGLFNGNNANPTYYNYSKTVNSVVLGQSLKSRGRKSNAGVACAKPFSSYCHAPPSKKPRKLIVPSEMKCIMPKTKSPIEPFFPRV